MTIGEILLRALKTAIQTFGGMMGAIGIGWLHTDALISAGTAALAAGLSVIWNAIMTWSTEMGEAK